MSEKSYTIPKRSGDSVEITVIRRPRLLEGASSNQQFTKDPFSFHTEWHNKLILDITSSSTFACGFFKLKGSDWQLSEQSELTPQGPPESYPTIQAVFFHQPFGQKANTQRQPFSLKVLEGDPGHKNKETPPSTSPKNGLSIVLPKISNKLYDKEIDPKNPNLQQQRISPDTTTTSLSASVLSSNERKLVRKKSRHVKHLPYAYRTYGGRFICEFNSCGHLASRWQGIQSHIKSQHTSNANVCCNYLLPTNKDFQEHRIQHHHNKLFHCIQCNKAFRNRLAVKRHTKLKHSSELPGNLVCWVCQSFIPESNEEILNEHANTHALLQ